MRQIADILAADNSQDFPPRHRGCRPTTPAEPLGAEIRGDDPRAAAHNPPAPVPCEYCGTMRYTVGFAVPGRIIWLRDPERCRCPEAVAAHEAEHAEAERLEQAEADEKMRERVRQIARASGMGDRFRRRTFANFSVTAENQTAYRAARAYADNFAKMAPQGETPPPERNGLYISGGVGTGKTHLAAAIANHLLSQGTAVICMTMIDLLARIKRTYGSGGEDESQVLATYQQVPLLIIDDLGKEPPTDWTVATIYKIVNARYEAYLPTVVTTNYADAALIRRMTPATGDSITAEATVDRLREMCVGVTVTCPSWRGRGG